MNFNQKKKQLNRGLSIVLAVLLVAALSVTVIAFVASRRAKNPLVTTVTSTLQTTTTQTTAVPISTEETGGDTPVIIDQPVFMSPLDGTLLKGYSADIPVYSITMEDYRVHCGVDIEADAGTSVYAAADGNIESVYFDPMMGQTVVITHCGGYKTVYRNLQTAMPANIVVGVEVTAGDVIGYVGDTALIEISDSPLLHFEILKDGVHENPLTYITVETVQNETNFEG